MAAYDNLLANVPTDLWIGNNLHLLVILQNTKVLPADQGPKGFYEGETATRFAAEMAKHGGIISTTDLKNYKAIERTPLRHRAIACARSFMSAGQFRSRAAGGRDPRWPASLSRGR